MKHHVRHHRGFKIRRFLQLLQSVTQLPNLRRSGILGSEPCILRLQHKSHLDELPQPLLVIGNQQRQRAVQRLVQLVHDLRAHPMFHFQQPLQFQPLRRLPHHGPTHPQLERQIPLRRQPPISPATFVPNFRCNACAHLFNKAALRFDG